jgi:hypothetical protein
MDHGVIALVRSHWGNGYPRGSGEPTTSETAMRVAPQVLLQFALLLPAQAANSQGRIARLPDGPAQGVSVERLHYEDEGAITSVGFRLSRLQHNGPGLELGVALFPTYLQANTLVIGPDAGVGYNISLPAATILLRGGAGVIAGLGPAVDFLPGAHVGAGLLVQVDHRLALRADLLRRWYLIGSEAERFWSFGLGFSILPVR